MNNLMFNRFARNAAALLIFVLPIYSYAGSSIIQNNIQQQYQLANKEYIAFSSELYQILNKSRHNTNLYNINTLIDKVNVQLNHDKTTDAIKLIIDNKKLIHDNINTKAIISIESALLKANEFNTAQKILDTANQESDPSLISNILFAFAQYYYNQNDWQKTIDLVEKIANDLPTHDFQHAMLIEGFALQKLRRHREAIKVYKKIDISSEYYTVAQINTAVSDFRQDWWTDAQDIINALLKKPDVSKDQILTDRLNTIIGYSFLQLEYFRNSRDAFRNVSLNSEYTNQALIGIALDAAYQKDFVGALNAAKVLNNRQGSDLEIDESHLLLPYFYEKLQQLTTASAGYTNAIKYYEDRLQSLKTAMQASPAFYKNTLQSDKPEIIVIKDEKINLSKALPSAFFSQVHLLNEYQNAVLGLHDVSLTRRFDGLLDHFAEIAMQVVQQALKEKSSYLTDYLNQSRYGLARMYDNSKYLGK